MKLIDNGINTIDDWFNIYPPKRGERQWVDGRSAKELARYIISNLPNIPKEIINIIKNISESNVPYNWAGEYVTKLPKKGEGRNYDMIMYNDDLLISIEAKADETYGNYLGLEFDKANNNKKNRINELIKLIYANIDIKYLRNIRYQLITALAGLIIETKNKNLKKGLFLIIVFKKEDHYKQFKIDNNNVDYNNFINTLNLDINNHKLINGIDIWFNKIEINIK